MARRLSALRAQLSPALIPASAAPRDPPQKKALPLYSEGIPNLLTEEQKYEFVSITVMQGGLYKWLSG